MMPTRVIGGRYVVLAELGRGGMGIVWRAEDRVMGRHVAVKELHLPDGLVPDDRLLFRERLLREARTAGRLNDPGIVTVYDVVTDNGVDHIVMELIEARTLADVVAASGPLDEAVVADIGRQLLAALQTAHQGGVVHRDVKPANVMLAGGGRVKLTDFGIAQAADDPRLTSTGALIGSPGYMSPERLEGGQASPAADLWALGATLYFAVQGTGPFQRDTTAATISAVLHADPPPTRTRGPLGSVITGLLQRSPQTRLSGPQAAMLLAAPGQANSPTQAGGPEPTRLGAPLTERFGAPVRARPWRWVAIAAAVGLLLGLVGGVAGGLALARSGEPDVRLLSYGTGGQVPVFEIGFQYCISTPVVEGTQIASGAIVDCDESHPAELFAVLDTFAYDEQVGYPEGIADYAARGCAMRFESEAVVGDDKADLVATAMYPTEAEFGRTDESGDRYDYRQVFCVLARADGTNIEGTRLAAGG
jgi:eukaryotic-like serine/threonine-protein kinase